MPDYRAYIVGSDEHFKAAEAITADNDEHALKIAEKLVDGHDVEVWLLDRKIAILPHKIRTSPTEPISPIAVIIGHRSSDVSIGGSDREELYRRLTQTRRLAGMVSDPTTTERLRALALDIEQQLATAEAKDADAPPE
jgi:hypothetical protein